MRFFFKWISFGIFALSGFFLGSFIYEQGSHGKGGESIAQRPSSADQGDSGIRSVIRSTQSSKYEDDLVRFIDSSNESVKVYTDILLLKPVLDALKRATEADVSVEIVLQRARETEALVDRWVPQNLSAADFFLVERGDSPTFIIVDDSTAMISSLSLSQADRINRDVIAVATREKTEVDKLISRFLKMKSRAL